MPKSFSARAFVALVLLAGGGLFAAAMLKPNSTGSLRFMCFLVVACLAARLKVKLPGITGSMSVNLPFILVAAAQMSAAEALVIGCISTSVQCLVTGRKFNPVQIAFNFANMALAITATRAIFNSSAVSASIASPSLRLGLATAGFFLVNTIPVAIIIYLTEKTGILRTWAGMFQLSFPYYVASAGISAAVLNLNGRIGWEAPLAVLPLMAGIVHSYRRYFNDPSRAVLRETQPQAVAQVAKASV